MNASRSHDHAQAWHQRSRAGETFAEIAASEHVSKAVVAGVIGRYRRAQHVAPLDTTPTERTSLRVLPRLRGDAVLDVIRWNEAVRELESRRYFTVVHLSDAHMPFQDDDALELAYQVVESLNPDLVVNLSDGFDFAQISHFAPDPDLGLDDILDNVRKPWWEHNDRLDTVARNAYRRALMGNHDVRLVAFLSESAPQLRATVLDAFDELVRYRGHVMFPDHLSDIDIACLTVMHGNKSTLGIYGPKKQLEARKYQRFIMAGHSHNPGFYFTRGPERAVASIVSGALCKFPHYIKDTTFNPWTQGFAYATVDVKARFAWLEHAIFEREGGLLKTVIGGRMFAQEIAAEQHGTNEREDKAA